MGSEPVAQFGIFVRIRIEKSPRHITRPCPGVEPPDRVRFVPVASTRSTRLRRCYSHVCSHSGLRQSWLSQDGTQATRLAPVH
jgi:hypothetical protein